MNKILIQMNMDGTFVRAFTSLSAASAANGFKSMESNLYRFIKRKITHCNKYLWAYVETDNPEELKSVARAGTVSPPLIWKAQEQVKDAVTFHKLHSLDVFKLDGEQLRILDDFITDLIEETK